MIQEQIEREQCNRFALAMGLDPVLSFAACLNPDSPIRALTRR
jgi:hypothetical protein